MIGLQVSWIRRKDFQLLTVGLSTHSSDKRFLVEHTRHMGHWSLRIKAVREEDRGFYECQLSIYPTQSIFIELKIVGKYSHVQSAQYMYVSNDNILMDFCRSGCWNIKCIWYTHWRNFNAAAAVQTQGCHGESVVCILVRYREIIAHNLYLYHLEDSANCCFCFLLAGTMKIKWWIMIHKAVSLSHPLQRIL